MPAKPSAQTAVIVYMCGALISFLLFMTAACMLLDPSLFNHPHWGLSYYGAQPGTMLPYYGGFALVLIAMAQVTRLLWQVQGRWRPLRGVFLTTTVLSVGIAATSYMQGAFLYWSHIWLCLALLLVVLGAEAWVLRQPGTNWLDYAAAALLVAGAVLVNLSGSWIGVLRIYYWAEVVLFVGAFACLTRAAVRATESR